VSKITVSKIFELSKYLATKSGQELKDALVYMSEFAEVSLRNLRNGLTFSDNFDCETKLVSVRTNTETKVSLANRKRPSCILVRRVISDVYYVVDKFGWKFGQDGDIVINITFGGSPAATEQISVEILILFG